MQHHAVDDNIDRALVVWQHPYDAPITRALQRFGEHVGCVARLGNADLRISRLFFAATKVVEAGVEYRNANVEQKFFGDSFGGALNRGVRCALNGVCCAAS